MAAAKTGGALGHLPGLQFPLGSNVIAGVQVEGTIADAQAQLSATQTQTQTTTRLTPLPVTTTSSFVTNDCLHRRHCRTLAVSALGRLGVLVDPRDLIYVIGAYTYGGLRV